jgi:hypothetical protein
MSTSSDHGVYCCVRVVVTLVIGGGGGGTIVVLCSVVVVRVVSVSWPPQPASQMVPPRSVTANTNRELVFIPVITHPPFTMASLTTL